MKKKRTGPDTCCYECAARAKCQAANFKTRSPCIRGGRGTPACQLGISSGGCLVCQSFDGAKPDDPNQTKLFQ
jgi:hypothetical protein